MPRTTTYFNCDEYTMRRLRPGMELLLHHGLLGLDRRAARFCRLKERPRSDGSGNHSLLLVVEKYLPRDGRWTKPAAIEWEDVAEVPLELGAPKDVWRPSKLRVGDEIHTDGGNWTRNHIKTIEPCTFDGEPPSVRITLVDEQVEIHRLKDDVCVRAQPDDPLPCC